MEVFQKVSDKPPSKCRKCGGKLEKLISAPAIQFKGSGWYVTDYARKNGSSGGKSEARSDKSSDASKSDSKPAPSKSETSAPKSDSK